MQKKEKEKGLDFSYEVKFWGVTSPQLKIHKSHLLIQYLHKFTQKLAITWIIYNKIFRTFILANNSQELEQSP